MRSTIGGGRLEIRDIARDKRVQGWMCGVMKVKKSLCWGLLKKESLANFHFNMEEGRQGSLTPESCMHQIFIPTCHNLSRRIES